MLLDYTNDLSFCPKLSFKRRAISNISEKLQLHRPRLYAFVGIQCLYRQDVYQEYLNKWGFHHTQATRRNDGGVNLAYKSCLHTKFHLTDIVMGCKMQTIVIFLKKILEYK